ncbi:MAG: hypothetical protein QM703_26270 [Gemmatales bacterium]
MNLYLVTLVTQLFTMQVIDGQSMPDPQIFRTLIGQRVVLEGLACDKQKGWSGRILIPYGHEVFVSNAAGKLTNNDTGLLVAAIPQGHLVRVVGVLTYRLKARPKPAFTPVAGITIAQPEYIPQHFSLEMESFEIIDRATMSVPRLQPK